MKKKILTGCLLLSSLITLCSCKKDITDTSANISFENTIIFTSSNNKLTAGDVYSHIINNQKDEVVKQIMLEILKEQVDVNDSNVKYLYQKYIRESFETNFLNNSTYSYNGDFKEEILVNYLKSEGYAISCDVGFEQTLLSQDFKCDYSDYIEKELDFDTYMKILKVKYIIEEKQNLILNNAPRKITYYTESKGSTDNEVREEFESYVASIEENYNSTEENVIKSIEDIGETKRKEALDELAKEYAYLSTSTDSSSGYMYLNKFTTCGEKKCSREDGKAYLDKEIMEKEYFTTKVVIKKNADVLYKSARDILFSENVEDYLYSIGGKNYLVSPVYASDSNKRINDIIMFDAEGNNYYISTVDVINEESSFADKALVAELLIDTISSSIIYEYCFDEQTINIYDEEIREHFISKYGKYEK